MEENVRSQNEHRTLFLGRRTSYAQQGSIGRPVLRMLIKLRRQKENKNPTDYWITPALPPLPFLLLLMNTTFLLLTTPLCLHACRLASPTLLDLSYLVISTPLCLHACSLTSR